MPGSPGSRHAVADLPSASGGQSAAHPYKAVRSPRPERPEFGATLGLDEPRRMTAHHPLRIFGSARSGPKGLPVGQVARQGLWGCLNLGWMARQVSCFSVLLHPKSAVPVLVTLLSLSLYAVGSTTETICVMSHITENCQRILIVPGSVTQFCHLLTTRTIMPGPNAKATQLIVLRKRVNQPADGNSARSNWRYSSWSRSPLAAINSSFPSARARKSRVSALGVANQAILLRRAAPAIRKCS